MLSIFAAEFQGYAVLCVQLAQLLGLVFCRPQATSMTRDRALVRLGLGLQRIKAFTIARRVHQVPDCAVIRPNRSASDAAFRSSMARNSSARPAGSPFWYTTSGDAPERTFGTSYCIRPPSM